MKGSIKRLISVVFLAFVLIIVDVSARTLPVLADQTAPQSDISLKRIGLSDLTAYGYVPTLDIWFPGFGDYELSSEGSYLFLEYDHSELVRASDSTVTVLLNDVPVASTLLTSSNAKRTWWKIDLPKDKLNQDMNHVQLKYNMNTDNGECVPENPSLYSSVYEKSWIHYEYASPLKFIDLPPPDLGRFPEPLLRPNMPAGEVAFVLPDNASSNDYSAAASVAARLGQLAGSKTPTVKLLFAHELDQGLKTGRNLIVVGTPDSNALLQELSHFLPLKLQRSDGLTSYIGKSGSPIDSESGILQQIVSPWDKRFSVLVVSGAGDEGLHRAARSLSSRLGTKPLQGQYAIVTQASEELGRGEDLGSRESPITISLRELQLDDVVVRGVGSHTVGFSFDMPSSDASGAYFDLVLSYSPLLDPEKSSVLVSLNGVPVRSVLLREENSGGSKYRLRLPKTSMRPGANSMAVTFYLYAPHSNECGALAPERTWAVLHPDSTLALTASPEQRSLDLANFPYPFVREGVLSGTYLVLPDDATVLPDSLQVASALGRESLGGSTEMHAGLYSQLSEEDKQRYDLVVYGLPGENSIVRRMGNELPLALDGSERRSLQRSELALLGITDEAKLGVLELIPSPWNTSKGLLLVTGTSSEAAKRSRQALQSRITRGNVAILSDDGKIAGFTISGRSQRAESRTPLQGRPFAYAAVALGVVILGLLGFMLVRVGRQGREKPIR
ncbi:MAG: cellulose biosynthesis cyclic di-GMP-binding regulatory protein BcsB [Chloroflexi bacterium]|nr:cellulose biosynthesis cyclic di-GMP-binding regulatory protein BcsB [Chloroflexota bacterium]